MLFKAAITATLAGLAAAVPAPAVNELVARQNPTYTDDQLLNLLLTAENLQAAFYRQGLKNYTAAQFAAQNYTDLYYRHLNVTANQDAAHVGLLKSALQQLGKPAVAECTYSFPATDPHSFVILSSVLEGAGVGGYLGPFHIWSDLTYAVEAGTILADNARHSTWMRSWSKRDPFANAFDITLYPNSFWTTLQRYTVSCPSSNPKLPFYSLGLLGNGTTGPVNPNDTVFLSTNVTTPAGKQMYGCWIDNTGCTIVNATPAKGGYTLPVPGTGFAGQNYVVLSLNKTNVVDNTILAGPAVIEVNDSVGY